MRKSVMQLFGGNLFSKLLGLVREVLAAALFGTGASIAAFRVAQTGTLSPVNFFTSDALNAAFVPLYKRFAAISPDQAQTFVWSQLGLFLSLSTLIGLGLYWGAQQWIAVLAPGLQPDTANLAVAMLQVMGLGVPFYLVSAILMFLAMAHQDFMPMAVRPVIQNIGLIGGTVTAFYLHNVLWFAWGFALAYVVFGAWMALRAWRAGWLACPSHWQASTLGEVMSAFWGTLRPLLLMPFMLQGNIVIERMVASLIGMVAVASLDYARFVTETLLLLISVPVGFAGLSHWSGLDEAQLRIKLRRAVLLMLLVAVPISAFLVGQSQLVVRIMYQRGAFDQHSADITAQILLGMALGLWAQVVGYVLIKAMNAQLRNRAALLVMTVALLANVLVNVLGYKWFGALTLGLGCAAYGIVLLIGTLMALALWRDCWRDMRVLLLAAVVYVLAVWWLPLPINPWMALTLAGFIALIYWGSLIGLRREYRNMVLALLQRQQGALA